MSDRQESSRVAFCSTVILTGLVVILVAYPLSYGPACMIEEKLGYPEWLATPIELTYAPLEWTESFAPERIQNLYSWYFRLWVPDSRPELHWPMPGDISGGGGYRP